MADSSCSSSSTEHFLGERRTKDIPSEIVWSNENSHIYSELTTTSESNERATILYSYLGPGMTRRQILCPSFNVVSSRWCFKLQSLLLGNPFFYYDLHITGLPFIFASDVKLCAWPWMLEMGWVGFGLAGFLPQTVMSVRKPLARVSCV